MSTQESDSLVVKTVTFLTEFWRDIATGWKPRHSGRPQASSWRDQKSSRPSGLTKLTSNPPSLRGEDTAEDAASVTGGFWIGFENCGDLSDPGVHHIHSIGEHGPARSDTWSRGRSRTMDATTWPGDGSYADPSATRRRSLYDAHMGAAHRRAQEPLTTDWRIKLREAPGRREPEVAAFCEAICRVRQGFPASDRSSNSGRIWSAAVPFPENVSDSEVEISITGAELHPALHIVQRVYAGNQGKHRVTKRGPALSNPMFTLVTREDIAKSASHTPIQRCLRESSDETKFWTFCTDQQWHSRILIAAACQTQRYR
ncbi:unnamed protein product [Ranitomeya imitator]|uniref:Uncharacterized protein n=1 Tax=Ranitomeya imitator TaxID=111125 RepID=A0ABN9LCY8_9NEOB|nr:unnamed protein product [Ranitomeya imitator]